MVKVVTFRKYFTFGNLLIGYFSGDFVPPAFSTGIPECIPYYEKSCFFCRLLSDTSRNIVGTFFHPVFTSKVRYTYVHPCFAYLSSESIPRRAKLIVSKFLCLLRRCFLYTQPAHFQNPEYFSRHLFVPSLTWFTLVRFPTAPCTPSEG